MWRKRNTTYRKLRIWREKYRKLRFLALFGPAWLAMMADMDASSIIGAAQVGAVFKYGFVWIMLLLIIPLYIIQEVAGRVGIVTGKGLGEIIREKYSRRISILMSLPMALTDAVTYIIEYLGIAVGLEVLGLPIFFTIPIIYIIHLFVVIRKKYIKAEKFLLVISALLIFGLFLTLIFRGIKPYSPFYIEFSPHYLFLLAATVGAVIMPFMLFFQASATAIKSKEVHWTFKKLGIKFVRRETLVGAIVTEILMAIVEMAFAGILPASDPSTFASAQELSRVMVPFAGSLSPYIFGIGLVSAGFLALVVISLGSAWGTAEALGIKRTNLIYIIESVPAVVISLLVPPVYLINLVLDLLVFFVFALIGPVVILGVISRNKDIMGEYRTSNARYIVYWISTALLLLLGILAII
ncbi:divalent metal cation transporter [Acidianus sulfidivorans JP7]|uniref:Divalent metal cation transporter n=1 Tax=Acidianus sulfidivorans JP7 TaxID=619593 RepID=A0A2U9INB0_9CREN|nr:divalent metal cation transporter [Acidianus sulfidivorans]AWR97486.1 divalent metal cation transporter [Acidianus sulfidivorans JP7]